MQEAGIFYFNLRSPAAVEIDKVGLECGSLESAYLMACKALPDVASELLRQGCDPMRCAFQITDGCTVLIEVPFDELVTDRPGRLPGQEARLPRISEDSRIRDVIERTREARNASRDLSMKSKALMSVSSQRVAYSQRLLTKIREDGADRKKRADR